MRMTPPVLNFQGAVALYSKTETPHFISQYGTPIPNVNEDHGVFNPNVGLLIADGVGSGEHSAVVSKLAIRSVERAAEGLQLRHMPPDEAGDAVREEILPYADQAIGWYKDQNQLKEVGTTLGGLLFARYHLITIGIGDTPVLCIGQRYNFAMQGMVEHSEWLTTEQGEGRDIYNAISGEGRPNLATDPFDDQVYVVPVHPGDRYMIATDGLLGDDPEQRITTDIYAEALKDGDAATVATRLAHLPEDLAGRGTTLPYPKPEKDGPTHYVYEPKIDDLGVGVLIAPV